MRQHRAAEFNSSLPVFARLNPNVLPAEYTLFTQDDKYYGIKDRKAKPPSTLSST